MSTRTFERRIRCLFKGRRVSGYGESRTGPDPKVYIGADCRPWVEFQVHGEEPDNSRITYRKLTLLVKLLGTYEIGVSGFDLGCQCNDQERRPDFYRSDYVVAITAHGVKFPKKARKPKKLRVRPASAAKIRRAVKLSKTQQDHIDEMVDMAELTR